MKTTFKALLFIFIFYTSFSSFSQAKNPEKVTLIEKLNGKRLQLYAKNTDTIPYIVFLRVTTNDYRRSSNRPTIKPVAPNSEQHLLTLIKLAGTEGKYEHQLVVNEVSTNLEIRKDDDNMQINFDDALKTANITLFESNNCNICEYAKSLLNNYKIAYNKMHIANNLDLLKMVLKNNGKPTENIAQDTFVLQVEEEVYRGINSKKELLDALKKHVK